MEDTEKAPCDECGDEHTASELVEHGDQLLCETCLTAANEPEEDEEREPDGDDYDPPDDRVCTDAEASGLVHDHLDFQARCAGVDG